MELKASKIIAFSFFFILNLFEIISGQSPVLQEYINVALKENLATRKQNIAYQNSIQELKEARGLFYPNLKLNARYSIAEGGRTIDIPINTIFTGYSMYNNFLDPDLNLKTPSQITDEEVPFLREKEHDTKLQLIQPLFNSDIYYNHKIKGGIVEINQLGLKKEQRQLVADVKTAYFNYLKSISLQELLDRTMVLLEENKRVNEKLYENDKVTIDKVYRSEVELSKLRHQMSEAEKNVNITMAYFNFLLNKQLDSPIIVDSTYQLNFVAFDLNQAMMQAVSGREELNMLKTGVNISEYMLDMNQSGRLPNITAVVDYGIQGEEYEFSNDADYILASFVMSWDLFKGFQNNAKIQQAKLKKDEAEIGIQEAEKQIKLEVIHSFYALKAAHEEIEAANKELQSTRKAFQIVNKKYREGQASLLEYIDARTSMTNAEQKVIISRYDAHLLYAQFEQSAALYSLP